ncbi:hypothetical protein HK098_005467 [Nowakowskiella sp. JEL0407]|nr:hypothetical protein HK098_005467 [Nowakowskiella sp. JEL0407]
MTARDFAKALRLNVEFCDEKDFAIFTNSDSEISMKSKSKSERKPSICDLSLFEPPTSNAASTETGETTLRPVEIASAHLQVPSTSSSSATTLTHRFRNLSFQTSFSKTSNVSLPSINSDSTLSQTSHENPLSFPSSSRKISFDIFLETDLSVLTLSDSDDEDSSTPTQSNFGSCFEHSRDAGLQSNSFVTRSNYSSLAVNRDYNHCESGTIDSFSHFHYKCHPSFINTHNMPELTLLDSANLQEFSITHSRTKQYKRGRFLVTEQI